MFQIVVAAIINAMASHAVRILGIYKSDLDDERNEIFELIARSDSKLFK
jgi:hypothetical protein